jgi:hypothetical protein
MRQRTSKTCSHQLHELKQLEAFPDRTNSIGLATFTTRRASFRKLHHCINGLIAHRCTMGFQNLADHLKRTRWIKEPMSHLLFDQIDVQDGTQGLGLLLLLLPALLDADPSALRRSRDKRGLRSDDGKENQ